MTAFPADAESNLFEGPYPEFFQALAHCAYPGDVRRIREAHSGWSEPREYPPLYDVQRGWDAPKTGKAFKILWLKCEDGSVRAWRRRRAQDWTMRDPYERIDPNEFRTRREEAERRMRLPPRQRIPVVEGYQFVGEPPLGERVDPQIPERDSFLILRANEAFLPVVVVSRDDILKRAPAALAAGAPLDASAKPDSAISFNEIVSLYRSLIGLAENREQADIIAEFLFWPIPCKRLIQARRESGFAGKSGRPKNKPGQ